MINLKSNTYLRNFVLQFFSIVPHFFLIFWFRYFFPFWIFWIKIFITWALESFFHSIFVKRAPHAKFSLQNLHWNSFFLSWTDPNVRSVTPQFLYLCIILGLHKLFLKSKVCQTLGVKTSWSSRNCLKMIWNYYLRYSKSYVTILSKINQWNHREICSVWIIFVHPLSFWFNSFWGSQLIAFRFLNESFLPYTIMIILKGFHHGQNQSSVG